MSPQILAQANASLTRDLHTLAGGLAPAATVACVHSILATLDALVHEHGTPPDVKLVGAALHAVEKVLPLLADAEVATEIQNIRLRLQPQALRPSN